MAAQGRILLEPTIQEQKLVGAKIIVCIPYPGVIVFMMQQFKFQYYIRGFNQKLPHGLWFYLIY